jgi:PEGA domain
MARRSTFLVWLMFVTTLGLAWPSDLAAQRRPPAGAAVRTGVAVPRTYPARVYRPYYGSRYSYGYGYPRYYPYGYSRYYYPYYSSFSFSFGFGFGFGWPAAYGYPYYGYPSYGYPSYGYPYAGYPYAGYPSSGYPSAYQVTRPPDAYQTSTQPPQHRASEPAGFGTLTLRVIPSDAAILVDGEAWERPRGENRFSIELVEGPHQVEVRKGGFGEYVRTVDIPGGRTFTLNVSLTPGESAPLRSAGSARAGERPGFH